MGAKWAPEGRVSRLGMDVAWRLVGVKEAAEAEPVFVSSSADTRWQALKDFHCRSTDTILEVLAFWSFCRQVIAVENC